MRKILSVVGARPNFMKMAPIAEELQRRGVGHFLVHTGQHYDYRMSRLFFEDLGLPRPDADLDVRSGTHARQTAEVMSRLDPVIEKEAPALVVVVGDVNSTMAAAITAAKRGIPVAHVEAGLRSFDTTMPEEVNRILTDAVSELLFTTEESANRNLEKEGVDRERVFFAGNTMIDTLLKHAHRADASPVLERLGVSPGGYCVATLHRASNLEDGKTLAGILEALREISRDLPVVFPAHPGTSRRIAQLNLMRLVREPGVRLIEPLGYLDFLKLMKEARIVLTDSGGIQEETTALGLPCLTLRDNTERPATITAGTNTLAGTVRDRIIKEAARKLGSGPGQGYTLPPLWDGRAAKRIVSVIIDRIG